jgi:hypothetical protein
VGGATDLLSVRWTEGTGQCHMINNGSLSHESRTLDSLLYLAILSPVKTQSSVTLHIPGVLAGVWGLLKSIFQP